MKARKKTALTLHAALKVADNGKSKSIRRVVRLLIAAVLISGSVYGIIKGVSVLHDLWIAQCVITDAKCQVQISATPHITEDHVREWFGLTNGCNLAEIDFATRRSEVLKNHPIVRDLNVTYRMPNIVSVALEERKPIARVNYRRTKAIRSESKDGKGTHNTIELTSWDAVDSDGVVFAFAKKDTLQLPLILEQIASTKRGERLTGRALQALRFIELAAPAHGLTSTRFMEVSAANGTYLEATTSKYSTLMIDWRLLDDPSDTEQPHLRTILENFEILTKKQLFPERCTFTVTDPNRIAVNPNEQGITSP